MDKLEEIRNELAGNTSFDEEHEEISDQKLRKRKYLFIYQKK